VAAVQRLIPVLLALAACGGGGGDSGPPPPPPPPYAQTTSTGLAIGAAFPNAATLPPRVLFSASEAENGTDLNGDGDTTDGVLHAINTNTGVVTNFGLAIVGGIVTSDSQFAFLVSEPAQGNVDLDGDGDALDAVWFVYDPALPMASGNPVNTALATPATGLAGAGTTGGFVLLEFEGAARVDWNGDGDQGDIIPRVFLGSTFSVSSLLLPAQVAATPLVARNGRVLYLASEASQAQALNGDGDQLDSVLFAVDFTGGLPARVPVGGPFPRSVANHPYALSSGHAIYFIDEASEGAVDFNFDGDATDAIIAVFDLATGAGETLPTTPLIPAFAVAGAPAVGIGAGATRAIVAISETGARRDLNNDFDQTDMILAWIPLSAAPTLQVFPGLALAPVTPLIDDSRGLVAVSEAATGFGGTDLNFDGDAMDTVIHVLDTTNAPGSTINLQLAVKTLSLVNLDVLLGVDETAQGNADINGNGLRTDVIQYYVDLGDPTPAPRGLGIVTASKNFFRLTSQETRIAAILPEGQSANYNDLNGDGDTLDTGLELITLDPSLTPTGIVSPTPFFAGEGSAGTADPLRSAGDTFVFPTAEAMAGADLNGDGDQSDTVLCYTRIQ